MRQHHEQLAPRHSHKEAKVRSDDRDERDEDDDMISRRQEKLYRRQRMLVANNVMVVGMGGSRVVVCVRQMSRFAQVQAG